MKNITAKWTGIRPMIMHNGQLVDPLNPYVKKIREITRKGSKKMTETDLENRDRLEWEGSLYWDDSMGPVVPSENIEGCVRSGAMKSRLGKDVLAAVFCSELTTKLEYDGPRDKARLYADPRFTLRLPVVIQKNRIMRVRPMFPTGWSLTFTLEYDDSIIDDKSLIKAMRDAGALCGLNDYRPKFGRFLVEV